MDPVSKGWVVTWAGFGINLTLGVLYSWNVIASALTTPVASGGVHAWTPQQAFLPYACALTCFALSMVIAGRIQDRTGPRWVATAGGALVGLGMIVASLSPAQLAGTDAFPLTMVAGFGVLTGSGIGFAYAATVPSAMKWFSPRHRGRAVGIVISGFGFSAVLFGPLTSALVRAFGVNEALLVLGGVFFVVVVGLAQLLADPPRGFVPPGLYDEVPQVAGAPIPAASVSPAAMLRTATFRRMWLAFACSTCAGLGVITALPRIAQLQLGAGEAAWLTPALLATVALGNGAGRLLAATASDTVGRPLMLQVAFGVQAVLIIGLRFAANAGTLATLGLLVGAAYGASLALMPAATVDFFGTRHVGANYGLTFTAWGAGGVLATQVEAALFEGGLGSSATSTQTTAFATSVALCVVAALLSMGLRQPGETARASRR